MALLGHNPAPYCSGTGGCHARWPISQDYPYRCSWLCLFRKWETLSSSSRPFLPFSLRLVNLCTPECIDELVVCLGTASSLPARVLTKLIHAQRFGWGFIGAPIAVAVTDNLLPFLLVLYVRFVAGSACWPGFTRRALRNWGPMIRLALPGLVMVEAECLAFEILTLASSYFGTVMLATQSILGTVAALAFMLPFSVSIASSTRIANLIGASLSEAAITTAKVSAVGAFFAGTFNVIIVFSLRNYIPRLLTSDPGVISLAPKVLPICAAFQLFDALAADCNGILRGLGRQKIGGWVQLFCYYAIAMPISMGTAFGLGWKLYGLWSGIAVALAL